MSANQEEEGSGAATTGAAPDESAVPNPETGVGLGAGEPNSFEPEESDTD
jgi:hypothetical protein